MPFNAEDLGVTDPIPEEGDEEQPIPEEQEAEEDLFEVPAGNPEELVNAANVAAANDSADDESMQDST